MRTYLRIRNISINGLVFCKKEALSEQLGQKIWWLGTVNEIKKLLMFRKKKRTKGASASREDDIPEHLRLALLKVKSEAIFIVFLNGSS